MRSELCKHSVASCYTHVDIPDHNHVGTSGYYNNGLLDCISEFTELNLNNYALAIMGSLWFTPTSNRLCCRSGISDILGFNDIGNASTNLTNGGLDDNGQQRTEHTVHSGVHNHATLVDAGKECQQRYDDNNDDH